MFEQELRRLVAVDVAVPHTPVTLLRACENSEKAAVQSSSGASQGLATPLNLLSTYACRDMRAVMRVLRYACCDMRAVIGVL